MADRAAEYRLAASVPQSAVSYGGTCTPDAVLEFFVPPGVRAYSFTFG